MPRVSYDRPVVTGVPERDEWLRRFRAYFYDRYEVVGFQRDAVLVRALRDGTIYRAEGRVEDPNFSVL